MALTLRHSNSEGNNNEGRLAQVIDLSKREKPVLIKELERKTGHEFSETETDQVLIKKRVKEKRTTLDINGQKVDTFYLEAGNPKKPTVLLIHGGGDCSSMNWRYQILDLAEHYRVIAPDLPGYGLRAPHPDGHGTKLPKGQKGTLDYYVNHFIPKFMDDLGVKKAHMIGNSMGGGIAAGVATNNPSRVSRLILIAPTNVSPVEVPLSIIISSAFASEEFAKRLTEKFGNNPKVVEWAREHFEKNKNGKEKRDEPASGKMPKSSLEKFNSAKEFVQGWTDPFWQYLKDQFGDRSHLFTHLIRHRRIDKGFKTVYDLGKLKMPFLVLEGEDDMFFDTKAVKDVVDRSKNGRYIPIEGNGHGPQYESAGRVNYEINEFLHQDTQRRGFLNLFRHAA